MYNLPGSSKDFRLSFSVSCSDALGGTENTNFAVLESLSVKFDVCVTVFFTLPARCTVGMGLISPLSATPCVAISFTNRRLSSIDVLFSTVPLGRTKTNFCVPFDCVFKKIFVGFVCFSPLAATLFTSSFPVLKESSVPAPFVLNCTVSRVSLLSVAMSTISVSFIVCNSTGILTSIANTRVHRRYFVYSDNVVT